ncbi:uncharacterized protein SPPG_06538 [Spizellomyces punctatus DAOM BR117]|uniref:Uncharacterized protein n=1 Tax=Spizellomyces punctatus (strain DAOM BR117) TaxID=645134 RepID=A0A0L0HB22_SPIPD|nr:uncharacterized protein SPPG_06538 [Spizellomyces punctatus DAOM BR117]KNC98131.1 hypothetical protein SPPG_06538 [Spizellomyces punctatus DAOM BR117]|eukprot:XP_016606171.1 hypothetical protein SPPG_06538 [Spizellomyces punctatus DAOM BR117]
MTAPAIPGGPGNEVISSDTTYGKLLEQLIAQEVVDQHKKDAAVIIDILRTQGQPDAQIWATLIQARRAKLKRPFASQEHEGQQLQNGMSTKVAAVAQRFAASNVMSVSAKPSVPLPITSAAPLVTAQVIVGAAEAAQPSAIVVDRHPSPAVTNPVNAPNVRITKSPRAHPPPPQLPKPLPVRPMAVQQVAQPPRQVTCTTVDDRVNGSDQEQRKTVHAAEVDSPSSTIPQTGKVGQSSEILIGMSTATEVSLGSQTKGIPSYDSMDEAALIRQLQAKQEDVTKYEKLATIARAEAKRLKKALLRKRKRVESTDSVLPNGEQPTLLPGVDDTVQQTQVDKLPKKKRKLQDSLTEPTKSNTAGQASKSLAGESAMETPKELPNIVGERQAEARQIQTQITPKAKPLASKPWTLRMTEDDDEVGFTTAGPVKINVTSTRQGNDAPQNTQMIEVPSYDTKELVTDRTQSEKTSIAVKMSVSNIRMPSEHDAVEVASTAKGATLSPREQREAEVRKAMERDEWAKRQRASESSKQRPLSLDSDYGQIIQEYQQKAQSVYNERMALTKRSSIVEEVTSQVDAMKKAKKGKQAPPIVETPLAANSSERRVSLTEEEARRLREAAQKRLLIKQREELEMMAREAAQKRRDEAEKMAHEEEQRRREAQRRVEELLKREEAERKRRHEEERKHRAERARLQREEQERKKREEEERRREEQEHKKREEEEKRLREEQARLQREEQERKKREEEEKRRREEQARLQREQEERKQREELLRKQLQEQERKKREEEEKRLREEQARMQREEQERKKREEEERRREEQEHKKREEEEKRLREEQARLQREEQERKKREEEEKRRREEQARLQREQEERKQREELLRKQLQEQERKKREEEEKRLREEQARMQREEQERKKREEEEKRLREQQARLQREEQERKKREEEERRRREEQARLQREQEERKQREELLRKQLQEQERKRREEQLRKRLDEEESKRKEIEHTQRQQDEEIRRAAERSLAEKQRLARDALLADTFVRGVVSEHTGKAVDAQSQLHQQAEKRAEELRQKLMRGKQIKDVQGRKVSESAPESLTSSPVQLPAQPSTSSFSQTKETTPVSTSRAPIPGSGSSSKLPLVSHVPVTTAVVSVVHDLSPNQLTASPIISKAKQLELEEGEIEEFSTPVSSKTNSPVPVQQVEVLKRTSQPASVIGSTAVLSVSSGQNALSSTPAVCGARVKTESAIASPEIPYEVETPSSARTGRERSMTTEINPFAVVRFANGQPSVGQQFSTQNPFIQNSAMGPGFTGANLMGGFGAPGLGFPLADGGMFATGASASLPPEIRAQILASHHQALQTYQQALTQFTAHFLNQAAISFPQPRPQVQGMVPPAAPVFGPTIPPQQGTQTGFQADTTLSAPLSSTAARQALQPSDLGMTTGGRPGVVPANPPLAFPERLRAMGGAPNFIGFGAPPMMGGFTYPQGAVLPQQPGNPTPFSMPTNGPPTMMNINPPSGTAPGGYTPTVPFVGSLSGAGSSTTPTPMQRMAGVPVGGATMDETTLRGIQQRIADMARQQGSPQGSTQVSHPGFQS